MHLLASTIAKLDEAEAAIDLEQSPVRDSIITSVNSEGHKSVNEIRFSGKKYAFAVSNESAKAESSGTNK